MEGWIKIHRQITENEFYFSERFTKTQAWVDLLILANHTPQTIFIRGVQVKLIRGELGYAVKTLAKRWRWNERTVNKYLNMLSKRKMIQCRKTNITTIISINNYDLYQGSAEQSTEQNTSQSTSRIHTDKNDKTEKNDKEVRAQLFAEKVYSNNGYSKEDLKDFIEHWTESGENQKKLRFEFEKTFDISRRIKTWMRNKERWEGKKNKEEHLDEF
jgi:hypothetical protein